MTTTPMTDEHLKLMLEKAEEGFLPQLDKAPEVFARLCRELLAARNLIASEKRLRKRYTPAALSEFTEGQRAYYEANGEVFMDEEESEL